MENRDKAYTEASKIDVKVNELLKKFPIDDSNFTYWNTFARTVRSSMELIERRCEEERIKLIELPKIKR